MTKSKKAHKNRKSQTRSTRANPKSRTQKKAPQKRVQQKAVAINTQKAPKVQTLPQTRATTKKNLEKSEAKAAISSPFVKITENTQNTQTAKLELSKNISKSQQMQELRAKYQQVVAQSQASAKNTEHKTNSETSMANAKSEPRIEKRPTFEDWQEKQKRLVEEAYEKKQEELKLQEVAMELEAVKPRKRKMAWILTGVCAFLCLVNIGIGLWIFGSSLLQPKTETVAAQSTKRAETGVDYKQKIVSETGEEFEPTYKLGAISDLVMIFPELSCNNDMDGEILTCRNASKLKLDDIALFEEDYEINSTPLTLKLKSELLEALTEGKHDLTFKVTMDGQEKSIGAVIMVEGAEPNCAENQTLEDGVCVEQTSEENEQPQQKGNQETRAVTIPSQNEQPTKVPSPTQPGRPTDPVKSPEQLACEYSIGPKEVYVIHWESDSQVHVIKGRFTLDATGAAKMAWVNGSCRPAINASGFVASVDNSMSADRAQILYGERVPIATIVENPGQDTVTWRWKNNSLTTEFLGDSRVVLGY